MTPSLTRRRALTAIAATSGAALMPRALLAQSSGALLSGAEVCALTPEVTEGPYYFDPELVRADIREDREGVPLVLRIQVVDAACAPLPGARVDVWHCDAQGVYSSYGGDAGQVSEAGETFLRGTQMADDRGVAEFVTIYPGWYRGRTTHVHFKVFLDEANVLTGQVFFPDALSEFLYLNAPAYAREGARDTLNDGDFIARAATRASHASIKEEDAAYLAQLVVGVDPEAVSEDGGRPPGPPPRDAAMPEGGPGAPLEGPADEGERRGSLLPGG